MSNNNPGTEETLRKELGSLGAREFEMVALTMEPDRGLAALRYATTKGVDHPIPYAIKIFDNPDWQPSGEKRRLATNQSVDITCPHCGGDRFVVATDDPAALYGESYAPCSKCNAQADTTRYVGQERRVTAPR
jgi:hypothetical protein